MRAHKSRLLDELHTTPRSVQRFINRMHEGMVDVNVAEWSNLYSRCDRTPVNRIGPASNMKYENGLRHR